MHIKEVENLTALCSEVYQAWSDFRGNISVTEIRIINKIFWCFDNNLDCGHKELVADLNIPSSVLSKLLKSWLMDGSISTIKSSKDKRRNYYYPSDDLVKRRNVIFETIKCSINDI